MRGIMYSLCRDWVMATDKMTEYRYIHTILSR